MTDASSDHHGRRGGHVALVELADTDWPWAVRAGCLRVVRPWLGVLGLMSILVTACAPAVVQQATQFTPQTGKNFRLSRSATVPLSTGYSTTLRANSRWELVGTIAQGEVYRTKDQITTVEGSDIHEAYIVVDRGMLVGFYLPVERTFSPVSRSQTLSVEP